MDMNNPLNVILNNVNQAQQSHQQYYHSQIPLGGFVPGMLHPIQCMQNSQSQIGNMGGSVTYGHPPLVNHGSPVVGDYGIKFNMALVCNGETTPICNTAFVFYAWHKITMFIKTLLNTKRNTFCDKINKELESKNVGRNVVSCTKVWEFWASVVFVQYCHRKNASTGMYVEFDNFNNWLRVLGDPVLLADIQHLESVWNFATGMGIICNDVGLQNHEKFEILMVVFNMNNIEKLLSNKSTDDGSLQDFIGLLDVYLLKHDISLEQVLGLKRDFRMHWYEQGSGNSFPSFLEEMLKISRTNLFHAMVGFPDINTFFNSYKKENKMETNVNTPVVETHAPESAPQVDKHETPVSSEFTFADAVTQHVRRLKLEATPEQTRDDMKNLVNAFAELYEKYKKAYGAKLKDLELVAKSTNDISLFDGYFTASIISWLHKKQEVGFYGVINNGNLLFGVDDYYEEASVGYHTGSGRYRDAFGTIINMGAEIDDDFINCENLLGLRKIREFEDRTDLKGENTIAVIGIENYEQLKNLAKVLFANIPAVVRALTHAKPEVMQPNDEQVVQKEEVVEKPTTVTVEESNIRHDITIGDIIRYRDGSPIDPRVLDDILREWSLVTMMVSYGFDGVMRAHMKYLGISPLDVEIYPIYQTLFRKWIFGTLIAPNLLNGNWGTLYNSASYVMQQIVFTDKSSYLKGVLKDYKDGFKGNQISLLHLDKHNPNIAQLLDIAESEFDKLIREDSGVYMDHFHRVLLHYGLVEVMSEPENIPPGCGARQMRANIAFDLSFDPREIHNAKINSKHPIVTVMFEWALNDIRVACGLKPNHF